MKTCAKTQDSVDMWVVLAGTMGSLLSGIVIAYYSFGVLGFVGTFLGGLIPFVLWENMKNKN